MPKKEIKEKIIEVLKESLEPKHGGIIRVEKIDQIKTDEDFWNCIADQILELAAQEKQIKQLNIERSEKYIEIVKNGNMDDMFDFGYEIGKELKEKPALNERDKTK